MRAFVLKQGNCFIIENLKFSIGDSYFQWKMFI